MAKIITFPESPRLKRLREILEEAESRVHQVDKIQQEINALMFEYDLLSLEVAPYEINQLAKYFRLPLQLEFNF